MNIISDKKKFSQAKVWDDKSIVIFCGNTYHYWAPEDIKTGIGGSEEAVIYVSRELKNLGYNVTVYNNIGKREGVYDGIVYSDHKKINFKDDFNIFISWRQNVYSFGVKAKQKIVWLHDLPNGINWDDECVSSFDKVFVLSKYHRTFIPNNVPEDKIYYTSNGIVPEDFRDLDVDYRQSKRLIYASNYARGLKTILESWSKIKNVHSDAELHVYYGWHTYDIFTKAGFNNGAFKSEMLPLFNQDGIIEHGRIGHRELLKEYSKSLMMVYPCTYAGEVNCIALTKAIATGLRVITNDHPCMVERNPDIVVKDSEFIDSVIEKLYNVESRQINMTYINNNSWKSIAVDWSENVFISKP